MIVDSLIEDFWNNIIPDCSLVDAVAYEEAMGLCATSRLLLD